MTLWGIDKGDLDWDSCKRIGVLWVWKYEQLTEHLEG